MESVQNPEALSYLSFVDRVKRCRLSHAESRAVIRTEDDDGARVRAENGRQELLEVSVDALQLSEKVAIASPVGVRVEEIALGVVEIGAVRR
jgi:hypothetical protein